MIKNAEKGKVYAIKAKPVLRLLSGGFKLTDAVATLLGIEGGKKQLVNYAVDKEANKLYIYKSDNTGAVLGAGNTFSNTGLKVAVLEAAGLPADAEIKGGKQVWMDVVTTVTEANDIKYFEITFDKVVDASDEAKAEKPTAKATADTEI